MAVGRRQHLAIVHKAKVFPLTCGLFRDTVREVAAQYSHLVVEEVLADTMAMRLVKEPERFEVIVTTNLVGDIFPTRPQRSAGEWAWLHRPIWAIE